ncbi:MFS transporter [Streptomyces xanthophaeus]|uniref:MFS transporter n=1 Tax=Streptomyces xanthophaeus TaxID=67385 RepID=UPI0026480DE8|nr:MFS transporter [Streptomyces xanthophaeus]WKD32939.1 MFS transporter [Streptomyces xanthophaeus]
MSAGTRAPADPAGRRVLSAALFASAPAEVLDFLLPLWAGSTLGAGASVVGALIAFEAVLSLIVRPPAGELADRFDQRRVAAAGAGLYALSFAGYALADSLVVAFVAAGLGGAGGALFWVALRAWTGQRAQGGDATSAYGKLLSAEGQGAFVGYLVAFSLLERGGYPLLFWLGSAACAVAMASLLRGPRQERAGAVTGRGERRGAAERRLLPLMVVSAVTAAAEAGLWMLLLLRLQADLGLSPNEIALVFTPGFVVFVLLPAHAHHLTDRLGRTPAMVASFAASALFAAGLAVFSTPPAIAVLWTVAAACFAAQIPVEQATVAAASGGRTGRAMGLYESARLAGVVVGPLVMGLLYEEAGWAAACWAAAATSAVGALVVPYAVRTLGLAQEGKQPRKTGTDTKTDKDTDTDTDTETETETDMSEREAARQPSAETGPGPKAHARKERREWYVHTAAFALGQLVLWALDSSWLVWQITDGGVPGEQRGPLVWVGRIWLTIWVIDTIWSWSYTVWPREKKPKSSS